MEDQIVKARDRLKFIMVALVALALVFSRPLATVITELWWFEHVGYAEVFWTLLMAQFILGVSVGAVSLVSLGLTGWSVLRGRNRQAAPQILEFRRSGNVPPLLPGLTASLVLMLSILMGLDAASHADLLLSFTHAHDFGQVDPLFGHDIGFYVFRVPFMVFIYERVFGLLVLCLVTAVVLHFLVGTIRVVPDQFMVAPQARRQLLGLLGGIFLLKAAGYWLDGYSLLYEVHPGATVPAGAAYTDVHVRLPILWLLMLLTFGCALSLWLNRLPRHWRTSLAMVTVLVLVSFSGDVVLPVLTQRFVVKPNEQERESDYLERCIKFTRLAYNLDTIQEDSFPANVGFTAAQRDANRAILDNIPLWDHTVLLPALKQEQEIRQYYTFNSVDNDRYTIDGQYRQVMLAARELSSQNLPAPNWITSHLTYTHGYGLAMTAANAVEQGGNPLLIIKNIPPQGPIHIDHPQIYFGESPDAGDDYCFVDTTAKEFDYQTDTGSAFIRYDGAGGIPIASVWEKWLYFLRFGESNVLLNADIGVGSQVVFHRNVRERASRITPWVTYDSDPYLVISNGKLFWILDGYTLSSAYPYSFMLDDYHPYNYKRNSVKAVVNAYDGSMQFFVSDDSDPIIATYASIFPGVFQPLSAMDKDLQEHLRYPRDLFDLQAKVYATFHMKDTQNFFNKQDLWQPAQADNSIAMDPYYAMLRLQGSDREEFVLMLPFTPQNKQNMVAWMAARCDAPHYGELLVYEFPRQKNIYGPTQIKAQLNQNPDISKSLTLWNQKGSQTQFGTLLVVPLADSLLYVQPLYLAAEQKTMPQLIAVIVSDGERIAMGTDLGDAVDRLLGQSKTSTVPTAETSPSTPASTLTWKQLVDKASQDMANADSAQKNGDWAAYGEAMKRLRADLQDLQKHGGP